MKVWVEIEMKGYPSVFCLVKSYPYAVCADGSISNWFNEWCLKGWVIRAVGVQFDRIVLEIV